MARYIRPTIRRGVRTDFPEQIRFHAGGIRASEWPWQVPAMQTVATSYHRVEVAFPAAPPLRTGRLASKARPRERPAVEAFAPVARASDTGRLPAGFPWRRPSEPPASDRGSRS